MTRPALEVADIFRDHGPAWREQQAEHLSLGQLKAMSAIEHCRSAALGGHVLRREACAQIQVAYNSCRNRHCPKCQATAAQHWLEARQAELLTPLRQCEWVIYAKRPFSGPKDVLDYLSRYTHWVAIANSRLLNYDEHGVTFKWKDYRQKGCTRHKTMTLAPKEFIRRFLLHILPKGLHRIRHYGLFANPVRATNLQHARELLIVKDQLQSVEAPETTAHDTKPTYRCRTYSAPMVIIEIIAPIHRFLGSRDKHKPP